jgi:hypothetical protein
VKKLQTDVHSINLTDFNRVKQAALFQQKEQEI